jgi:hypothetical protein
MYWANRTFNINVTINDKKASNWGSTRDIWWDIPLSYPNLVNGPLIIFVSIWKKKVSNQPKCSPQLDKNFKVCLTRKLECRYSVEGAWKIEVADWFEFHNT